MKTPFDLARELSLTLVDQSREALEASYDTDGDERMRLVARSQAFSDAAEQASGLMRALMPTPTTAYNGRNRTKQ